MQLLPHFSFTFFFFYPDYHQIKSKAGLWLKADTDDCFGSGNQQFLIRNCTN